ncbi:hypothetical protein PNEG_02114 [Pneumocystis murina B123]|uniref:FAM192A/Fyv6 N-terminal domain-containing protein n=1 Tax=Pneumocystis murina (strain B123) TaxID=1069680 RepID=M7NLI7_PNEMU|nr:hypothetical protein PNEG_02114 [Pneumocystis murina B123]EMR09528.1 hypothetical protein PNEG_02114 [Pneumocystis murina B123]
MKRLEGDFPRFTSKRSKEWEEAERRVQAAKNPVENEPQPDHRSLYEKLQANRIIKEEEYQESWKLSNLIRTLDDEEIDFLDRLRREKIQVEKEAKKLVEEGLKVFRRNVLKMGEREQFDQSIQQSIYRSWSATEISKSPEINERPLKKMKEMTLKGVILKKNKNSLSKQNDSESKDQYNIKSAENTGESNNILSNMSPKKNKKAGEFPESVITTSSIETTDQKLIVYTSGSDEREE